MFFRLRVASLALVGLVASCAPPPAPVPPPRPAPPPPVRPAPPPPAPVAPAGDWRDIPLTPGDWRYNAETNEAQFVLAGSGPAFVQRCDLAGRRIELLRTAGGGSQLRIRTSSASRSLAGMPTAGGLAASLPASDPLLDAIAFSRGRFTVQSDSGAMLVLPAWPEPARAIEDCRA